MKTWNVYAFVAHGYVNALEIFGIKSDERMMTEARMLFGDDAIAVDVSNLAVGVGDRYHDDAFWHVEVNDDGTETETKLEPVPSEEDRIEAVETTSATNTTSIDANTTAIDDILVMLLDDTTDTDATT